MQSKPKLLAICDSPTCSTGFGIVSRNVLEHQATEYEIHILGVNYYGDPHPLQTKYHIYTPQIGGDVYGFGRLREMIDRVKPDIIWILNDPWLCAEYVLRLRKMNYAGPIVVYTPIDSPAIKPDYVLPLNQATHIVAYNQWGLDELRAAGLTIDASVIYHGVNQTLFHPMDKQKARRELFKGSNFDIENAFIVLYVGRNQPRKRVDLFPYIISEWMRQYPHDNVYFHYHGAPKGDLGNDTEYLAHYYGVDNRFILTSKDLSVTNELPIERLKYVYCGADVYLHICAVEGHGLPLHEAMACGIPSICPQYSALQDWADGGAYFVDVDPMPWHNPNNVDTLHKFIDVQSAVEALEKMYANKTHREEWGKQAHAHATQPRFTWKVIGKQFKEVFNAARVTVQQKDTQLWKKLNTQLTIK